MASMGDLVRSGIPRCSLTSSRSCLGSCVSNITDPNNHSTMSDKKYIGAGKAHDRYDSITVTIDLGKAHSAVFTTQHGTFLRFVVTKRQQPDDYGKTHACFFVPKPEPAPEPTPDPAPKKRRQKKDHLSPSA